MPRKRMPHRAASLLSGTLYPLISSLFLRCAEIVEIFRDLGYACPENLSSRRCFPRRIALRVFGDP